jgi:hypothetical protein
VNNTWKCSVIATALAMTTLPAPAAEGALGRSIPGAWVMPQAGVVGPQPGFSFSVMPIGYVGSISGNIQIPVAGSLVANVSGDTNVNFLIPQYVYKTETPKVSLASSIMAPVGWLGVSTSAQLGSATAGRGSANAGLGDIIVSPLTAGIHFSDTNHLAISAMIFAPTGAFTAGNLSNPGLGHWIYYTDLKGGRGAPGR